MMGVAAVFNPCGVALLPASLAWVAGTVTPSAATRGGISQTLQAAGAGVAMATGFMTVVALLAVGFHAVGSVIHSALRPLMLGLGAALSLAGASVAVGRWHLPLERWTAVPARRGGLPGSWLGWVGAGCVYAVGSLSCTLPLFVAAVAPLLAGSWQTVVTALATMGAGTAAVLVALSLGAVWARGGLDRLLSRLQARLSVGLGAIVSAAGLYLIYYWGWGPGRWLG